MKGARQVAEEIISKWSVSQMNPPSLIDRIEQALLDYGKQVTEEAQKQIQCQRHEFGLTVNQAKRYADKVRESWNYERYAGIGSQLKTKTEGPVVIDERIRKINNEHRTSHKIKCLDCDKKLPFSISRDIDICSKCKVIRNKKNQIIKWGKREKFKNLSKGWGFGFSLK